MMDITLKDGHVVQLDNDALDDWELLELMQAIDDGQSGLITKAFPLLVGEEQFANLKSHLKGERTRLPASEMIAAFYEILSGVRSGKK